MKPCGTPSRQCRAEGVADSVEPACGKSEPWFGFDVARRQQRDGLEDIRPAFASRFCGEHDFVFTAWRAFAVPLVTIPALFRSWTLPSRATS